MFCYIHYMISNDQGKKSDDIFNELYNKICSSKLIDSLSEIRIVTCGNLKNLKTDFSNYKKCSIVDHNDDLLQFEFPTLLVMKKDCELMENSTPILYMHLKGVTSNQDSWRNDLLKIVVDKHDECLQFLKDYNACGPRLADPFIIINNTIQRHFSGNFWWTKSEHIKNLPNPDIQSMIKDFGFLVKGRKNKNPHAPADKNFRYLAEMWIGLLDTEKTHKLKEIK